MQGHAGHHERDPRDLDPARDLGQDNDPVIDRFTLYGQTTTSIVQSAPVTDRGLTLGPTVSE
jgi:hypothetical protein